MLGCMLQSIIHSATEIWMFNIFEAEKEKAPLLKERPWNVLKHHSTTPGLVCLPTNKVQQLLARHTHTLSLTHTDTLCLSHTHTLCLSLTHTHTQPVWLPADASAAFWVFPGMQNADETRQPPCEPSQEKLPLTSKRLSEYQNTGVGEVEQRQGDWERWGREREWGWGWEMEGKWSEQERNPASSFLSLTKPEKYSYIIHMNILSLRLCPLSGYLFRNAATAQQGQGPVFISRSVARACNPPVDYLSVCCSLNFRQRN